MTSNRDTIAMAAVALAGFTWGVYWIPLRALDGAGIPGPWAIVAFYLLPVVLLLPLYVARRRSLLAGGWPLHVAGLLAGTALVTYAVALIFTDVVRALLFYYMTPLWSTLLARAILGERITPARLGTMALGLAGLLLILRFEGGLGGALNLGDWMGLASGLIWAGAAVYMKRHEGASGVDFALSYFFWGGVVALALTLLPFEAAPMPDWSTIGAVLIWLVPVALILIIPPAFAVMWGATILSPGLLAMLFMTEISAGTVTAAIWAGEPFGMREAAGVILISAAGLCEPLFGFFKRRR